MWWWTRYIDKLLVIASDKFKYCHYGKKERVWTDLEGQNRKAYTSCCAPISCLEEGNEKVYWSFFAVVFFSLLVQCPCKNGSLYSTLSKNKIKASSVSVFVYLYFILPWYIFLHDKVAQISGLEKIQMGVLIVCRALCFKLLLL